MNIIGVGVNWHDGYANDPSVKVKVDKELPKDLIRKSYFLDDQGQSLSREQMAAVGAPIKATGKLSEILYAEDPDSGYVTFFKVGNEKDYPRGAAGGKYIVEIEDGSGTYERTIASGWYVSEAVINNSDEFEEICDVSFITPQYRNLAMAGNMKVSVLKEAMEKFFPWAEIVALPGAIYTVRIKGQSLKSTWMKVNQVDLEHAKAVVCQDLGINLKDPKQWRERWKEVTEDPRYLKIKNRKYSDLLGQEFMPSGQSLMCSLCGEVETPDEYQRKIIARQELNSEYFLNWCKNYHACKGAIA